MNNNCAFERDQDAVSAAVATVLLFGGVLSIIGLMMVSMVPVIQELEGSVERHDMSSQMTLLAHKTSLLSETGMPGDTTSTELIPVDGNLAWDKLRGGMWYSATWGEDMSLRAKNILDFDDQFEVRHPESETKVVCLSDLRLGVNRPYYYDIPNGIEQLLLTAKPGLALPLGPIDVSLSGDNDYEYSGKLLVDDVFTANFITPVDNLTISSTHELNILALAGSQGATYFAPNQPEPSTKLGRSWSIPLPTGSSTIHMTSKEANQVDVIIDGSSSTYYGLPDEISRTGTGVTLNFELDEPSVAHIFSSSDSQALLQIGANAPTGITQLPSTTGSYIGQEFLAPNINSTIRLDNPGKNPLTVIWRGGGITVEAYGYEEVHWPPSTAYDVPLILESDLPFTVTWSSYEPNEAVEDRSGMMQMIAKDTGFWTGAIFNTSTAPSSSQSFDITLRGYRSVINWSVGATSDSEILSQDGRQKLTLNVENEKLNVRVNNSHPISIVRFSGSTGAMNIIHNGMERCQFVGILASGWIPLELPWESLGGRSEVDVENAWYDGRHPSSIQIDLIGTMGIDEYATIGTVWSFHLSRLTYQFSTSIRGMEVAYSGGAVVTNHPEFNPYVVVPPSDRGGPGPRFAATIPALHPSSDSVIGGGKMSIEIELSSRTSLASTDAYEIRRGWNEPYGEAIAEFAGQGLDGSDDWTVYPTLDLLTDYVGWVPDPSIGTSEVVWHTNGEVTKFSLQLSALEVKLQEANA